MNPLKSLLKIFIFPAILVLTTSTTIQVMTPRFSSITTDTGKQSEDREIQRQESISLRNTMLAKIQKEMEIPKSENDELNYHYMELSNELKVVLIQDEKIKKSAAAMNVSVGSLEDPKDVNGLAHFLEHMLFMGTNGIFLYTILYFLKRFNARNQEIPRCGLLRVIRLVEWRVHQCLYGLD